MTFTEYSSLREYTGPQLPDCPIALLDQTARRIARQFCEDTQAWQYDLSPIRIRADKRDYQLSLDDIDCAEIFRVWSVRIVKDEDTSPDGVLQDPQEHYTLIGDHHQKLRFTCTPKETISKGLRVRVSLRPLRTATEIECFMFDEYYEGLASGVMGTLMAMPKKPWTDLRTSREMKHQYATAIAEARIAVSRGYMNADIINNAQGSFAV